MSEIYEYEVIPIDIDRHTTLRITTKNPNDKKQIVNITGAELVFQAKTELSTGASVLFELKNETAGGTGIEDVSGLVSGIYKLHITPDHLTGLDVGSKYWGETKMILSGKETTIFRERIVIMPSMVD